MSIVRTGLLALLSVALIGFACDSTGGGGGGVNGSSGGPGKGHSGISGTAGSVGNSGAGGATLSGTPIMQCKQLRTALCARMVDCMGDTDPNNDAAERAACDVEATLPCDKIDAVAPTLSVCVNAINGGTCAALFPGGFFALPASCEATLTFRMTPVEMQCNALINLLCQREIDCGVITGATLGDCVAFIMDPTDPSSIICSDAVSVSATYDQCMSQLQSVTCAVFNASGPPVSCNGVVTTSTGAGGTGGTGAGGSTGRGGSIGIGGLGI